MRSFIFQLHLWFGVGAAIYILVISVSGSAIVLRREVAVASQKRIAVIPGPRRLQADALQQLAQRSYPDYEILSIGEPESPSQPDRVVLERSGRRILRLFDPYTGSDLGDPVGTADHVLGWLTDLHDNLLSGVMGRIVNGAGSMVLVFLSLTGAVVWWPGVKNWRRSMRVNWDARFARLNWDLHSAAGFWFYLFVLVWGVSGILLCFPGAFDAIFVSRLRLWMTRLHFGRFNVLTEVLWTVFGLSPAFLAATGILMWWNRVLRKKFHRRRNSAAREVNWKPDKANV